MLPQPGYRTATQFSGSIFKRSYLFTLVLLYLFFRLCSNYAVEEIHVFGPEYRANATFRNLCVAQLCVALPGLYFFSTRAYRSESNWKFLV